MTKEDWVSQKSLELGGILFKGFASDKSSGLMMLRDMNNCNERMLKWLVKTFDEFQPTEKK